jgi:hypothetical protein
VLASLLDGFAVQIALGDTEATPERAAELSLALAERELNCDLRAAA